MICVCQSKKRQYDQEVENLERQQKQTIERLEQEHTNRLRDEAKRIKAEQDKELSKYQNMLKNHRKEVRMWSKSIFAATSHLFSPLMTYCPHLSHLMDTIQALAKEKIGVQFQWILSLASI